MKMLVKDGVLYLSGDPEKGFMAVDAEDGEPL